MPMSRSSYIWLRRFRANVQRVLVAVRENKPFFSEDGQRKPQRDDLLQVVEVLKHCRRKTLYPRATPMRAIAASIEYATQVFSGKGALSSTVGVRRYFLYILNHKNSGKYRYQDDLILFLIRLRNKVGNSITLAHRTRR